MPDETPPSTPHQKGQEEYLTASGVFTKTDRLYLLDEQIPDNKRTAQKRRQRIRNRLQTAFVDLNLAAKHLSHRDRHLLFTTLVEGSAPTQGWDDSTRQAQLGGLQQTLRFIYDGLATETDVDADELFMRTFSDAEWPDSIPADIDGLVGALRAGRQPTLRQYAVFVELLHDKPALLNEVVDDPDPAEATTELERKLVHIQDLAQREVASLWRPVLEAAHLPYDEETLQVLTTKTRQAQSE